MEDIELDVGGTKFKGVWIAILFSFASTIGGGIWTASEFFNRLDSQEQAVQESVATTDNIANLFTNLSASTTDKLAFYDTRLGKVEQQLVDNDIAELQGKLATLGANLEQIMKRQGELLDLRDKISTIEKTSSEQSIILGNKLKDLEQYDEAMEKISREIDDLWSGLDALSNPLN